MERNLTILIAEDGEDDALFLRRAMKKLGWANPVHILTDGGEVMKYLKGEEKYRDRSHFPFPSVLFMDIKMPRVSGFDVLQWLRDHPGCRIIPIIMFSGSALVEDVERAYQLGANAYIVKPMGLDDLTAILKSTFDFWSKCAKPRVPDFCV